MNKFTFAAFILSAMLVNIAMAKKCPPPQDLIDRLEGYQSKTTNDREWNELDRYIDNKYKEWNDKKHFGDECSFISRAYQEIIQEEGIPTNFSEERKLSLKVSLRASRLSSEDYNKKYDYGYNYSFGKANKCPPPQDLIDRLEGYQSKAANDEEWININSYIHGVYDKWNDEKDRNNKCRDFLLRAYQEIIKEEGIPTNFSEERKLSLKVSDRADRLERQ